MEGATSVYLDDGMSSTTVGKIFVLLRGHEQSDRKQLMEIHLGAIAQEFDLDLKRDREHRRMDAMEKDFMSKVYT